MIQVLIQRAWEEHIKATNLTPNVLVMGHHTFMEFRTEILNSLGPQVNGPMLIQKYRGMDVIPSYYQEGFFVAYRVTKQKES